MAFLREPQRPGEPIFRAPASVIVLIVVIAVAHVLRVLASASFADAMVEHLALVPARYATWPPDARAFGDAAVPLLGYIFVHANATHLIVNCLWLLAFGAPVARRFGTAPFLTLFFVSGLAGAFAHLAGNWGSTDAAVGASGAIAGVMAAGIRAVPLGVAPQRKTRPDILPLTSRQVVVFSAVWVVANLVTGLTGIGSLPGVELVAWQAHLGGYAAGLFLASPFERWAVSRGSGTGIAA